MLGLGIVHYSFTKNCSEADSLSCESSSICKTKITRNVEDRIRKRHEEREKCIKENGGNDLKCPGNITITSPKNTETCIPKYNFWTRTICI